MIALDTNVLVRYIVGDDPRQLDIAGNLIENELNGDNPGYVSLVVLAEFSWVLRQSYKIPETVLNSRIRALLTSPVIVVESAVVVERALSHPRADFSDALIHELGRQAGCDRTVTFDHRFGRTPGVKLLRA